MAVRKAAPVMRFRSSAKVFMSLEALTSLPATAASAPSRATPTVAVPDHEIDVSADATPAANIKEVVVRRMLSCYSQLTLLF